MDGTAWRRYAVYYAPRPWTALARFGAAWLGRDAESGAPAADAAWGGPLADRRAFTAGAARYGFHATLKAPFRLAPGEDAAGLDAAVRTLAAAAPAFPLPELRLEPLGPFLALTLGAPCAPLDALAAACVAELDRFRAPPSAEELDRRRAAGLSAAQDAHLRRWGYPFVFDAFRFHLTLTDRLPPERQEAVAAALAPALAPALAEAARVEDLCLFGEGRDGLFQVVARHPLAGSCSDAAGRAPIASRGSGTAGTAGSRRPPSW